MKCGRCGAELELNEVFFPQFKLTEYGRDKEGAKLARQTTFCEKCQAGLKNWLREEGYFHRQDEDSWHKVRTHVIESIETEKTKGTW